jgi:LuxR family transcriptional regulator, regulator of acetate metabolism
MSAEPSSDELFAGPVGAELARRLLDATRSARALLGAVADDGDDPDPEALLGLIAGLGRLLGDDDGTLDVHRAALERVRSRYETRSAAIERAHAAAAALRALGTPETVLERAPRALAEGSALERVVLSRVRDGAMHVEAVHVAGEPEQAAVALGRLAGAPVRLAPPLIEVEILRRRRATVVSGAQLGDRAHRPLATVMGWSSYVATAVVVRGEPVALLHADRGRSGTVDALDRDVLWEFADGVAQAHDGARLALALAEERAQLRRLLRWLEIRAAELEDGSLDPFGPEPDLLPGSEPADPTTPLDDRAAFEGVLTRRELDVLRLLVAGCSNREVGERLVLSPGTVKFHVNSILRKLGAANRAQAVARYLAATAAQPRSPQPRQPSMTRSAPL